MKRLAVVALAFLPFRADGFASVAGIKDNHREQTRRAIDELAASAALDPYPDLTMYAGWTYGSGAALDYGIVNGSADESAHYHPRTGEASWRGDLGAWRLYYREQYDAGNFHTAYNAIGHYIHLIEDGFSCPHIYLVDHDWDQWDDFEFRLAPHRSVPATDPGSGAHAARYPFAQADYDALQYRPGFLVFGSEFVAVPDGRRFWLHDHEDDDDGDETTRDAGDSTTPDSDRGAAGAFGITATFGSYGGQYESRDLIPGGGNENGDWFGLSSVRTTANLIIDQQLWAAKEAAKRELRVISETLPPLAKGFVVGDGSVEVPPIDRERGTPIRFEIFENRTPDVFVTIQVEGHGPIRDAAGTSWNRRRMTLPRSTSTDLPFVLAVDLVWKGDLDGGQSLHDRDRYVGRYRLRLTIEDSDGRASPYSTRRFGDRDGFGHYEWEVEVANEKPFARALEVIEPPTLIYTARWVDRGEGRVLEGADASLPFRFDRTNDDELILFRATFNNEMGEVRLRIEDVEVVMRRYGRKEWRGDCRYGLLRRYESRRELRIYLDGTDTGGAVLDSNPATVPVYRRGESRMEGYEFGSDATHRLRVEPPGPAFAERVEVRQAGRVVYRAEWNASRSTRVLEFPVREDLGGAESSEIDVEFSSEVKEDSIQVRVGATNAAKTAFQGRRWTGSFDATAALGAGDSVAIVIRAETAAGLRLDADPTTVAEYDSRGWRWMSYEDNRRGVDTGRGGDDTWHELGAVGDSWVIVLDASGSMRDEDKIGRAKAAIREALGRFAERDEVALVVFRDCHLIAVEQEFTRDHERIARSLDGVHPQGGTPYYAAARFAREYLERRGRGRVKHPPLMFSDGQESCGGRPDPAPPRVEEEEPERPPDCVPQQWSAYRVQRRGANLDLILTRYVERETMGGCTATLTVETYGIYYGRFELPSGGHIIDWGVNSRPSDRSVSSKRDADGIRALRAEAEAGRPGLVPRAQADRQIDALVRELVR